MLTQPLKRVLDRDWCLQKPEKLQIMCLLACCILRLLPVFPASVDGLSFVPVPMPFAVIVPNYKLSLKHIVTNFSALALVSHLAKKI